jgi:hypothetical protein
MAGLSVSDIVNVTVTLTPVAAPTRNFGALLIIGSTTGVIDTNERLRVYTTIGQVATDFGTTAQEYLAASLFFSQNPQPAILYIGRWAEAATRGRLRGATLTTAQQALTNFTAVTNGGVNIVVDGVAKNLTGLNFSSATNLNSVASTVQTALGGGITCVWDATYGRFVVTSATTGTSSTVAYATAGAGTDVSGLLGLTSAAGAVSVAGIAAETPLAAVTALANASTDWYGCMIADTSVTDSQHQAVAGFIEAASPSRIYGITTQETIALDPTHTDDIGSLLQAAGYRRSFTQYSSSSAYAAASLYGRAFTVDFTGNRTTITLKFKQEPGVTYETRTESQAATLKSKNINVFVGYNNTTAIIQEGVMANGYFFDEIHGTDWLQNAVQTNVYNLLLTSPTKIPQTDEGVNMIVAVVAQACTQAVTNGLLAPGLWQGPPLGAITTGQTLSKGFYIYAPSVDTQNQSDRQARKAPLIQVAAKQAGAVHFSNVAINVNR